MPTSASAARPSGTVTFLFTDLQGSTNLWQEHREVMLEALAWHDRVVRQAVEGQSGYVFKTVGDAFYAAFSTAPEAVAAACEFQAALNEREWPGVGRLRVRAAVHSGSAEERDGDYFGPPLNRVARLLATVHGGQTVLSLASEELIRDQLPPGATLRHLGEHQLKDLGRPEQLFQLVAPGLDSEFPPPRSLDYFPHNLPVQLTSFIGREREMREVAERLGAVRLLTLTGPGGTGKTRLSVQAAADRIEEFPDGVWFVELAPLADPGLVPQAVAAVLKVPEGHGSLTTTLTSFLRPKRLLLVLDNCEHVVQACAQVADSLLRVCTGLKILASSREPLAIAGETTYPVPTLSLPPRDALVRGAHAAIDEEALASLSQYEAVRLFIDRAAAVSAGFEVTSANAPAVAQICYRLDGIPLAIELAAARVKVLAPEEIAERLDDRFRLLTRGSRTALPRQQTLRALIDWSHDLLSEPERVLFRRLAAFAGGLTLEAAEAVCGSVEVGECGSGGSTSTHPHTHTSIHEGEILDLLTQLVDRSLVMVDAAPGGSSRYRLLETVREYARERLAEAGEAEAVGRRHLAFYVAMAEAAAPLLLSAWQAGALHRLAEEHDNLRGALDQTARHGEAEARLRIVAALGWFWIKRGYLSEGRRQIEEALRMGREQPPALRLEAMHALIFLTYLQGDHPGTRAFAEAKLALAEEARHPWHTAFSHFNFGIIYAEEGDFERAQASCDLCLSLSRNVGDPWLVAAALRPHAVLARLRGDFETAALEFAEGEFLFLQLGDRWAIGFVNVDWAEMELARGHLERARAHYRKGLEVCSEIEDRRGIAWCIEGLGQVAWGERQPERSARLMGAAAALLEAIGGVLMPVLLLAHERAAGEVREALGSEPFERERRQGRRLTQAQAIREALG